ncbi:MAG: hypothetical protein KAH32_04085, partial [Chlamydiia bacterium]|nr:hypothetical protein [Chlamydiia bacterium]
FIDDKKSLSSYERACRAHILFMINILPDRFSILYRLGFGKSWARSIYYDSEKKNHYEKTNGLQDVLYSTLGFRLLILSKIFSEISIGFDLKRGEISNTIKIDIKTKKEKNQILLDVDSVGKKFIYGVSEWCSKIFLDASIFINLSKIVGIHCIGRISLHDNNSLNNMSSRLYDILIGINLTTD